MAVKKVIVVDPDILVILLERDVVAFVGINIHNADVSDFQILGSFDAETPAICSRIITDAFNSHRKALFFAHIDGDVTLVGHFGVRHISQETNHQRALIIALLERS